MLIGPDPFVSANAAYLKERQGRRLSGPPGVREVADGLILTPSPAEEGLSLGGVIDPAGTLIAESKLDRYGKTVIGGAYDVLKPEESTEEVVFLGYFVSHLGQFLLESLSRVWFVLKDKPNAKLAFCRHPRRAWAEFPPAFHAMTQMIPGLSDKLLEVTKPTVFSKVIVPAPAFVADGSWTEDFLEPFKAMRTSLAGEAPLDPPRDVYIERPRKEGDITILGEDAMPSAFEAQGFQRLDLPLDGTAVGFTQALASLLKARRVAGLDGSHLHTVLFSQAAEAQVVLCLSPRINPSYWQIDDALDLKSAYLHADAGFLPAPASGKGPYLAGASEARIKAALEAAAKPAGDKTYQIMPRSPAPRTLRADYIRSWTKESAADQSKIARGVLPRLARAYDASPATAIDNRLPSDLDAIGIQNNTDKATIYRNSKGEVMMGHDYLRSYEVALAHLRNESFTLLELGIGPKWNKGASLRTWRGYFPKAEMIGIDIRPDCLTEKSERIDVQILDLGQIPVLRQLSRIDAAVIMDDASHFWRHQILAMCELFLTMKPGGIYVLEDLHTSFPPLYDQYHEPDAPTGYEFVNAIATRLVSHNTAPMADMPYPEYVRQIAEATRSLTLIGKSSIFVRA